MSNEKVLILNIKHQNRRKKSDADFLVLRLWIDL